MENYLYSVIVIAVLVCVWLSAIASFVVVRDKTLETKQKVAQIAAAWVLPVVGPLLTLYLIAQHSPELIQKKWIPWPFRNIVFGRNFRPNANRNENDDSGIDLRAAHRQEQRIEESIGSGGGGGSD